MRKVRPGEVPSPLSVWSWGDSDLGVRFLALGLKERAAANWGTRLYLVAIRLTATPIIDEDMIWTEPSTGVGVGPVLGGWWCLEEGPPA